MKKLIFRIFWLIAAAGVYVVADNYASAIVLERITGLRVTLVSPTGRQIPVQEGEGKPIVRRPGSAFIDKMEGAAFGYQVTYAMMGGKRLICTYRLPGIKCEDGWSVMLTQRQMSR